MIEKVEVVRLYHKRPDGTHCLLRNADGEPLAYHNYPLYLMSLLADFGNLNLVVRKELELHDTRFPIVWDPEDIHIPSIQAAVDWKP